MSLFLRDLFTDKKKSSIIKLYAFHRTITRGVRNVINILHKAIIVVKEAGSKPDRYPSIQYICHASRKVVTMCDRGGGNSGRLTSRAVFWNTLMS